MYEWMDYYFLSIPKSYTSLLISAARYWEMCHHT